MSKIFICYRREAAGYAGRLIYDRLIQEFDSKQIFIDVDDLEISIEDFICIIKEYISKSKVFLCLIDRDWLACKNKNGKRRLDDPEDYVRLEITTALESHICVAPILLQNVEMPSGDELPSELFPLSKKNAFKVRHKEFNTDMARLIKAIHQEIEKHCYPSACPLEFVDIPEGTFQMGSEPAEEGRFGDEELHEVSISAFAMSKYPITFAQYDYYLEEVRRQHNGVNVPDTPDDNGWERGSRPVINISANEALKYAAWLSKEQGWLYRLPTEAEWEYAARAESVTPFHFGNTLDSNQANFAYHHKQTVEVGKYPANKWGLYDIHGNVSEWTCSKYVKKYAGKEQKCADKATLWTFRGGSWSSERELVRCAARANEFFKIRRNDLGFRLVRVQE